MKLTVRIAAISTAAVLALPLVSCLDYREELWIKADGSGKIQATISIDSQLGAPGESGPGQPDQVEAQLKDLLASIEGAGIENYQSYTQGGKRVWDFTATFRDLRQVKPAIVAGRNTIGAVFGDFEIEKTPAGHLSVRRVVDFSDEAATAPREASKEPGTGVAESFGTALGKAMGGLLANTMFSGHYLDYTTHFPTAVIGANSADIDRESSTVSWRIPLAQASQGPVTMTAEIARPRRWLPWTAIGLGLIVIAAFALRRRRWRPAV